MTEEAVQAGFVCGVCSGTFVGEPAAMASKDEHATTLDIPMCGECVNLLMAHQLGLI
jgi:hypothetical protein